MKYRTLFISTLLLINLAAISQSPCLPEGITFTTQEEIDNFQVNYPNCSVISGNVEITGYNITNLNGLSVLTGILGNLHIWHDNTSLSSLAGLDNLLVIGDDLIIGNENQYNGNPLLTNLSGLNGLTEIGGLKIIGSIGLTSLTGLENITSIFGDCLIAGNGSLTNIAGLNGLTSINGRMIIDDNPSLIDFSGLNGLTSINGRMIIVDNPSLINLSGLEGLTSVNGDIEIYNNPSLTSLTGLENLDANSISDLQIFNNENLTDCHCISICDYLVSGNGSVNVYNNAPGCNHPYEIASDCGFNICLPHGNYHLNSQSEIDNFSTHYPDCDSLEGEVIIRGEDITNLNGLNDLTRISGTLYIGGRAYLNNLYNPNLITLSGLESLTSCGELRIEGNDSLVSIAGLNNLVFVEGNLFIGHFLYGPNPFLKHLGGFSNLTIIGGYLSIDRNFILENLSGLENLTEIGESLILGTQFDYILPLGNPLLEDIKALSNLSSIGNDLHIQDNPSLQHLSGLEGLTSIGSGLYIDDNSSLLNLSGLDSLTSINANVAIGWNGSMTSLEGLNNLESINGDLSITFNDNLTQLNALHNVDSIEGHLVIHHNGSLSTCHVQSICDYLAAPNGSIYIHDNAPGCNSPEEVLDSCNITVLDEEFIHQKFTISPNPVGSAAVINYLLRQPSLVTLKILDIGGREMAVLTDEIQQPGEQQVIFDGSQLKPGVYFCTLKTNNGMQTKNIIKL